MKTAFATLAVLAMIGPVFGADLAKPKGVPDFTKGEKIPVGAKHDWNLGATGLRGWIYCDKMVTSDARQIAITKVEKGSPADGVLAVGDVILGVGGKPFSEDPRTEMGKALTHTESEAGNGNLSLTRWRAGNSAEVVVKLPVLGTYSATAPYDCPKSKHILEQGCKDLAKRMADPSYAKRPDPIPRSLNALALLASGDSSYLPLIKKETEWAANFKTEGMATWYYGYVMMFLAEYRIATGDESVMTGLKRLTLEAAHGQSAVGSWGHRFAQPDGRLYGYGMMNAPGLPLTISLVMAREAGVRDPALDLAIERSAKLLRFYIGKGAIPYGDHGAWIETHEDNGKCGMAAVLFNLMGESKGAEFFSRMSVASHGSERDAGHTGNFFNILWAIPGVAQSGPQATGAWMTEFGSWHFDLARRWDNSYQHQGPPENEEDSYAGWDCTGGYLLAYAMPLKKLCLTGKKPGAVPQLDAAAVNSLILDGRGWNNKDRNSFYDAMTDEQLLKRLRSWSPVVRERAAMALGRRKNAPVAPLVEMLDSPSLDARYGACQALIFLGGRGAPAVDALRRTLAHQDLWLRIKAAEALAAIGTPAMMAVPQLLELLAQADVKNDPRGMQQRYLSFALFERDGMLGRSLEGVDRPALHKAVRAGLKNEDGRARGSVGSVYRRLSFEEIKPLLPAIHEAILQPAPSGEMFADGIRVEGLRLLSQHHIEEGLNALVKYTRDQNPWESQIRTPELMKILLTYGTHAKVVIPELTKIAHYFEKEEKDFPPPLMRMKARSVRETIAAIEASTDSPKLIRITEKLVPGKDRIDVPAVGDGLCLHNLFQSGMVLQHDKPIRIWGWAEPGEKVTVTFGEKSQSCTAAADRLWKVELPALPASSEPRTLVVQGKATTLKLVDILLGDVWLLGGQSNMEFPIFKVEDGELEIVSANFKNIRLFTVPQLNGPDSKKAFPRLYQWSDWFSTHYRQGYWDVCSPETVREMSAIGYTFARRLHMATQIPIGVIDASRGGTCIETWLPLDLLRTIDTPEVKAVLSDWDKKVAEFDAQKDLEARIKQFNEQTARLKSQGKQIPANRTPPSDLRPGPAMDMNRPGNCFASMIAPLAGFQIKGALWHQGYNNALAPNGHVMYYQVFAKMIGAWREAFTDPKMPFGIISQETEGDPQDLNNYLESFADEGIYIREVHYKTFLDFQKAGDKNIGYASSFDQRRAWFHPQIKIPVGERIAGWALMTQYGKSGDLRWLPPTIREMKAEGGKMILKMARFEVIPYNDGPILGFAIAGKDGKFHPAKAEWSNPNNPGDRSLIVLSSPLVAEPVYFRHAWGRNPLANLKAGGIPLDVLRNDNFTVADMYEIYMGKKSATPNILDRTEFRDLRNALKAEDVKHRLKEAEAFIKERQGTNEAPQK